MPSKRDNTPRQGYIVDVYQDDAGKYRWRFTYANRDIMADSGQGYVRRDAALAGFQRMRRVLFTGTAYTVRQVPNKLGTTSEPRRAKKWAPGLKYGG